MPLSPPRVRMGRPIAMVFCSIRTAASVAQTFQPTAIQRIEMCNTLSEVHDLLEKTTRFLGCDSVRVSCSRGGVAVLSPGGEEGDAGLSGPTAIFRLSSGHDLRLTVALHLSPTSPLAADIAFRFLQRLSLATAERLERLAKGAGDGPSLASAVEARDDHAGLNESPSPAARPLTAWLKLALGWDAPPVRPKPSLGEE